jgi:hypothetical protein
MEPPLKGQLSLKNTIGKMPLQRHFTCVDVFQTDKLRRGHMPSLKYFQE